MNDPLHLRQVPAPHPWEAWMLYIESFPVSGTKLGKARTFLRGLTAALARQKPLHTELALQFSQIHIGDGSARYASHSREWETDLGLGVWPDREPPANWTTESFMEAAGSDRRPIVMHRLLRITTSDDARENARDLMLGLGTIVQISMEDDHELFLGKMRDVLKEPIKDPSFTHFRFYLPLIEGKTLKQSTAPQLDKWLCGAELYIRESPEDNSILLLSRHPLGAMIESLGCELTG